MDGWNRQQRQAWQGGGIEIGSLDDEMMGMNLTIGERRAGFLTKTEKDSGKRRGINGLGRWVDTARYFV